MNKTFIFLAFLLLSANYIQGKPEAINELFEELLELNAQVKTSTYQVSNLFDQARSESMAASAYFATFENNSKMTCARLQSDFKSFMTKLSGDMVAAKAGMASTHRQMAEDKSKSAEVYKENQNNIRGHQQELERQRDVQKTFRQAVAEANRKLVVVKHVKNIINDELLNATRGKASLIQVTTVTKKLQELRELMAKDEDTMFSHIVETLIEMTTEQNLNDQGVLRNLLAALRKLRNSLRSWVEKATADNEKLRKISSEENAARLKTISNSEKLLADYAASETLNRRTLDELNNVVVLAEAALSRKTREFQGSEALCQHQSQLIEKIQKQGRSFAMDLVAVEKALPK